MLPSWIRSSIGICARPYLRAIETTSRRLALMNVSTACWPSSASHSSSSSGGRHRGAALLAADPALGEQVLGHQAGLDGLGELDLGRRRRAAGCGRSRRGRGRRCRGPRSRASGGWCVLPCAVLISSSCSRATTPRVATSVQRLRAAAGFPASDVVPSPDMTSEDPRELHVRPNSQGLLRGFPGRLGRYIPAGAPEPRRPQRRPGGGGHRRRGPARRGDERQRGLRLPRRDAGDHAGGLRRVPYGAGWRWARRCPTPTAPELRPGGARRAARTC